MLLHLLFVQVLVLSKETLGKARAPECQPRMQQLFLGFRHGARATFRHLPNNPNNDFFTVGPVQLTKTGLRQMYVSGENVRNRYAGFIRPYVPEEVRIRSSVIDRTVMSASTFAAALFKPTGNETWLAGLTWQPVAIFTTKILMPIDPTDREILKHVFKTLIESDSQLMETVIEIEKATATLHRKLFKEFIYIIENFKTEMFYNLTLPYDLDNQKHKVNEMINKLIINSYAIPEIFCLNAPAILRDIIRHTYSFLKGTTKEYLNIYSMHDSHISAVFAALTVDGVTEMTPFAATFFVEIHQDDTCEGHIVKLLYRSDVTTDASELEIHGCGQPCRLDKFRWIVENILTMCRYNTTKTLDDDRVTSAQTIADVQMAVTSGSIRLMTSSIGLLSLMVFIVMSKTPA